MRRRIHLCDPVTLGFRLMLRAEHRMARRRIFWARAKYAGTLVAVVAGVIGSTIGLLGMLSWLQIVG